MCNLGEYLNYENCKCRKKLVAKLVDECTETVKELKLAKITLAKVENSYKCSSCSVYCVILDIFYNCLWNRCLFCLFALVFKKKSSTC